MNGITTTDFHLVGAWRGLGPTICGPGVLVFRNQKGHRAPLPFGSPGSAKESPELPHVAERSPMAWASTRKRCFFSSSKASRFRSLELAPWSVTRAKKSRKCLEKREKTRSLGPMFWYHGRLINPPLHSYELSHIYIC